MNPLVPVAVMYAGLAGVLLALLVATAQNKWQPRVFVLLALRLAIGWHFLFEGLHKIQSTYVGPSDTNKVFTSEPYFAAAEGPLGEALRKKYIGDPDVTIRAMLVEGAQPPAPDVIKDSAKMAELCPAKVADDLKAVAAANIEKAEADAKESKDAAAALPDGTTDAEKKAKADATVKANVAEAKAKWLRDDGREMRAAYARWVYGVDRREAKLTYITGDLLQSGPERLHAIALMQKEVDDFTIRQKEHLGNGNGIEMTRTRKVQTDLQTAKTDLAKDAEAFVKELKTNAGIEVKDEVKEKPIADLDRLTRWTITLIGAGLLIGLFTRWWCLAGIGFLVMTYLSHPTVPWLPLPPGTEGNPLFINKNLIEALGLLVILAHPTGRWLGLDALVHRVLFPRAPDPV